MAPIVVLITGASRGIGKGLLELYLAKPHHTVIAANREPEHDTSKALFTLPRAEGTSLLIVKIDATSATDPLEAVQQLASHRIKHLDIIIANVGIALIWPKVSEVKVEDMQAHMLPNVYGFVWLYQATLPLLKRSENPMWVTIGSSAAYMEVKHTHLQERAMADDDMLIRLPTRDMIPMQNAAYGPTKLVGHWLTKHIHMEEPTITAFPIDPGFVQTEMGNRGAGAFGLEKATITVEQSVTGMIKVLDDATRETHGGKLWVWDGNQARW